jgi:hypothetical protein
MLGQTGRFVLALALLLMVLGSVGSLAFLFGTSPDWWWYSAEGRAVVAEVRERILAIVTTLPLDRMLLGVVACGFLAVVVSAWRSRRVPRPPAVFVGARLGAAVLATGLLCIADAATRVLAGSLFGLALTGWAGFRITQRFLRRARTRPRVGPSLRPLGVSLLLFVGIFLAVAGPWHVAIFISQQSGYFTDFIIEHNLARVGKVASQSGGAGFYLPVILFALFPWSCVIPASVVLAWRAGPAEAVRRWGFELFLCIACLVTLAAFSSATTKFPHYIAPLLIPLAVLIGRTLDSMLDRRAPSVTLAWCVVALAYLPPMFSLLARNGAELLVATFTVKDRVASDVVPGAWFPILLWTLAGLWFVAIPLRSRRRIGVAVVTIATVLGGCLALDFIPRLTRDKTMQALCRVWSVHGGPSEPIGIYGDTKFGLYFYTNRQLQQLDDAEAFLEFMRPGRPAMCVVQRSRMRSGRRAYLARYPGHDLYIVERSHRTYATVANHPIPER